jgi:nicotinate-nucleotide adenylyltransferase
MPDAELYFITGADALADIFTWRDADELFELATSSGCTRPGYEMDPETLDGIPPTGSPWSRSRPWRSPPPTAATAQRGEPVWYLVPDGVVQYIAKHDLYPPRRTTPA